jgi:DNA-binding LacI/PurR family transcriptional regulator
MSDVLARGALQATAELGIAVPAELSIVGFDDSPAATLGTPALTTVAQPHEEKGRIAAEWLVEAIEQGQPLPEDRRLILPTELIVRESTAPPKNDAPRR